jgi:hypothetical protein
VRGEELSDNELQVSLSGEGVSFGVIAANQFLDRAKNIGTLVRRTTERVLGLPFQSGRRIRKDHPVLYMATPTAGSFSVTYRLGTQSFLDDMRGPEEVLPIMLEDIQAADKQDWQALQQRIKDEAYMANFLALLRQIAPDGSNVRLVGFTARQKGVSYKVPFQRRRGELLIAQSADSDQQLEVIEGILDGAERSKRIVKVNRKSIKVPEGIDDIVRPLWGQAVKATVKRQNGSATPVLIDVESLDS